MVRFNNETAGESQRLREPYVYANWASGHLMVGWFVKTQTRILAHTVGVDGGVAPVGSAHRPRRPDGFI